MRVKLTGLRTPEHWLGSSRSSSPQVFMRSRGINFSLCVNEATHGPQMCRGSGEGKLSHAAYSELQWPRYRAAFRVEERIKKVEQREIWMLFVMFTLRISTALWYYTVALNFRDSWLYDIFSCYNEGGRGYWHLLDRGREAAQIPTMHRTAPAAKNNPTQNVNSAKTEKLLYHVYIKRLFYFGFFEHTVVNKKRELYTWRHK